MAFYIWTGLILVSVVGFFMAPDEEDQAWWSVAVFLIAIIGIGLLGI